MASLPPFGSPLFSILLRRIWRKLFYHIGPSRPLFSNLPSMERLAANSYLFRAPLPPSQQPSFTLTHRYCTTTTQYTNNKAVGRNRFLTIHPSILQSINQCFVVHRRQHIKRKLDENKHTCRSVHPLWDTEAFPLVWDFLDCPKSEFRTNFSRPFLFIGIHFSQKLCLFIWQNCWYLF